MNEKKITLWIDLFFLLCLPAIDNSTCPGGQMDREIPVFCYHAYYSLILHLWFDADCEYSTGDNAPKIRGCNLYHRNNKYRNLLVVAFPISR